jgi:hypothetical protein
VPTRSNRRFTVAARRLRAMLADIIDGYRAAGIDHGDLMSILMRASDDETGTGMSGRQLRDEATTLVIAGSETTGNTIAWACYLLATHPQAQERLQAEVDLVLAGTDASYEMLAALPYTRAVITEALRLYSPVWILPRRAIADVELGGHQLRAGSRIMFSPYALNRDARLHRDPDRFDPGRWATDYTKTEMRASFFPFGQGIRNCIGEGFAWTEALLLLSAIAARWHLSLADGAAVHPVISSTLVPSELPVIVTRRSVPGNKHEHPERWRVLPRRADPVPALIVHDVLQRPAVGLDHSARGDVGLIAGNQDTANAEGAAAVRNRRRQHRGGVPLPSVVRRDVVSDMPAAPGKFRSQPVADDDGAQVSGPVHVPERRYRNAPVLLFVEHALDVTAKVRRHLVNGKPGKPALVTKVARGCHEGVTHGRSGRGKVRHLAAQPIRGGGEQCDDAVGFGDVVGPDVRRGEPGLSHRARGGDDVICRACGVDGKDRGLLDLVVGPADRVAVRPEHVELAGGIGPGEDVAGIGVLGDQPQGLLLPGAADHQVRVRPGQALR